MNISKLLVEFVTVFVVTLLVSAIVTLVWSLIFYGTGAIDWGTSFRFAIILGILLTWTGMRGKTAN